MTILAAMSEGEARGIGETAWSAVNDFGDQSERLKRARTELFQEQQLGKIVKIAFVRNGKHRAETLEIDIGGADVMARWQPKMTRFLQSGLGIFASDFQQRGLRRFGFSIDQVHDRPLVLADDAAV